MFSQYMNLATQQKLSAVELEHHGLTSDRDVTLDCPEEEFPLTQFFSFMTVCPIQGLHGSHGKPRAEHGATG